MAQTKRKRRSKHRGNAAGMVEVRGRTGRPVDARKGRQGRGAATASTGRRRGARRPTASAIATVLFVVVITVAAEEPRRRRWGSAS